jgi:serine/threonine protein phosphatase 1
MIWPFRQKIAASPALQAPETPVGIAPRRFVIPDIHGCDLTLRALVEEVITLVKEDILYLLGDYIDRGPRSREVLDYIMKLGNEGYRVLPLRGNHEDMFLNACADRGQYRTWILNGGYAALDSFGVEDACEVPLPYRRFCNELPCYHLLEDFLLVHAGFNFEAEDPYADTEAMLWDRTRSVNREVLAGRTMISGHTPQPLSKIEKMLKQNSGLIILDNGCFLAGRKGMGSLLALELNSMVLFSQKNIDIPGR